MKNYINVLDGEWVKHRFRKDEFCFFNCVLPEWTVDDVVCQTIEDGAEEEPFYIVDLGEIVTRYQNWRKLMPRVQPFYAVKCNEDEMIVRTLAALGTGFDCASRQEIDLVTGLGVDPDRIIYAHTAKMTSHIRYAAHVGVTTTTFDSCDELIKLKNNMPRVRLVLRIRCDAKEALLSLGCKFGCDPDTEAPNLLKMALELGLEVIGVSFHVGYGAKEFGAYASGIRHCANLIKLGKALGFEMSLVDIGGGFPGEIQSNIEEAAEVINRALERYFPDDSIRVIAEPGKYFACAAGTLAACIIAKRKVSQDNESHTMYYISDGIFGSFMEYTLYNLQPKLELVKPINENPESSSVWGPTCNSRDYLLLSTLLPPLPVGDWFLFRNMGAYAGTIATTFNGFPKPKVHYVVDRSIWSMLKDTNLFTAVDFECKSLSKK